MCSELEGQLWMLLMIAASLIVLAGIALMLAMIRGNALKLSMALSRNESSRLEATPCSSCLELKSALRAEREHVVQLQRKVQLTQIILAEAQAGAERDNP